MSDLLNGELLRLRSRWFVIALVAGGILISAFLVFFSAPDLAALSEEEISNAKIGLEKEKEYYFEELGCEKFSVLKAPEECKYVSLSIEDFLRKPLTLGEFIKRGLSVYSVLASLAAALLAAGVVGGEFSSGGMGTQLTFTPSRGRVLVAKTVAACVGVMTLTVVWVGSLFVFAVPVCLLLNGPGALTMNAENPVEMARFLLATLAVGLVSLGVTFLTGSGVGAAIIFAAAVAVSSAIEMLLERVESNLWVFKALPMSNVAALYLGHHEIYYYERSSVDAGIADDSLMVDITYSEAWCYSLLGIIVIFALAVWRFRRRDILK